jgi:carboxypeptidase PM20D1
VHPVLFIILVLLAVIAGLLVVMVLRALGTPKVGAPGRLAPSALEKFAGVEEKLAEVVKIPTVSRFDESQEDSKPFKAFPDELEKLFPSVREHLRRDLVGNRAILYEWTGSNPSLEPAIFMAHYDVVPPGETAWTHPPFSGDIADGYVWGRGTQDTKITLTGALAAAEQLLSEGFHPARTMYFSFGGDEEVGGARGAEALAKALAERGVKASFLIDEGGMVADGMLSFADRPLALVGIAEKGYIDVELEAKGTGGHASMPPRSTAAGAVSRAVARLEAHPFPARLTYTVRSFLTLLSPYVPFGFRLLFRNTALTSGAVIKAFSASPTTNAMVRTTQAATMLSGSDKENVLPDRARAILNVRILPGESVASVLSRMSAIVARDGVTVKAAHEGFAVEPLPESPTDHEGYRAITAAMTASYPEAATVPFLFSAGSDTKHYNGITKAMYRIQPIRETPEDLKGVHGPNERITVENVRRCALFYYELIKSL